MIKDYKLIRNTYNGIKKQMPHQDHDYKIEISKCFVYGDKCSLYFICTNCKCLLIYTAYGGYKFNTYYDNLMIYDIEDINKFLTCKEVIIKNIIE